jgi:hypothetical protein
MQDLLSPLPRHGMSDRMVQVLHQPPWLSEKQWEKMDGVLSNVTNKAGTAGLGVCKARVKTPATSLLSAFLSERGDLLPDSAASLR